VSLDAWHTSAGCISERSNLHSTSVLLGDMKPLVNKDGDANELRRKNKRLKRKVLALIDKIHSLESDVSKHKELQAVSDALIDKLKDHVVILSQKTNDVPAKVVYNVGSISVSDALDLVESLLNGSEKLVWDDVLCMPLTCPVVVEGNGFPNSFDDLAGRVKFNGGLSRMEGSGIQTDLKSCCVFPSCYVMETIDVFNTLMYPYMLRLLGEVEKTHASIDFTLTEGGVAEEWKGYMQRTAALKHKVEEFMCCEKALQAHKKVRDSISQVVEAHKNCIDLNASFECVRGALETFENAKKANRQGDDSVQDIMSDLVVGRTGVMRVRLESIMCSKLPVEIAERLRREGSVDSIVSSMLEIFGSEISEVGRNIRAMNRQSASRARAVSAAAAGGSGSRSGGSGGGGSGSSGGGGSGGSGGGNVVYIRIDD